MGNISKESAEAAKKILSGYEAQLKAEQDIIIEELKGKLKKIDTRSPEFKFKKIDSVNDSYIKVQYYGHHVGGSYIHDYQVAPSYVRDIEYTTNRRCEWTKRYNDEYDHAYTFKVYHKQKISDRPYIPQGKILRIEASYAFLKDCGIEWACLYLITKDLQYNSVLKNYGFEYKNDFIYIDEKKTAYVLRYNNEEHYKSGYTSNCMANRTAYDCIFDLLIPEKDFIDLFRKKHELLIRDLFKELNIDCTCKNIGLFSLRYPNGYYYSDDHHLHIFTKEDILTATERYRKYESGRKFITIPSSGETIELKNGEEVFNTIFHSFAYQSYNPSHHDTEHRNCVTARLICKTFPKEFPTKDDFAFIASHRKYYPEISHF